MLFECPMTLQASYIGQVNGFPLPAKMSRLSLWAEGLPPNGEVYGAGACKRRPRPSMR